MADTFLKKKNSRELLKAATDTSLTYQRINDRVTKMNYEFWDLIKEKIYESENWSKTLVMLETTMMNYNTRWMSFAIRRSKKKIRQCSI